MRGVFFVIKDKGYNEVLVGCFNPHAKHHSSGCIRYGTRYLH